MESTASPVTARPLRRDAARNRTLILMAAREVFAERGLGATLDDVAHRAGLGVGTVYRRFADRDSLIEALFEQRLRDFVTLAEDASTHADAWTGLVDFLEGASARMAADRGLREALLTPRHGHAGVALARAELDPRVDALVQRAHASGQLRPDVDRTDFPAIMEAVLVAADLGGDTAPQQWRRMLHLVLDGLRTERAGPTALPVPPLSEDQFAAVMDLRLRPGPAH